MPAKYRYPVIVLFFLLLIGFTLWYTQRPKPIPVRVHAVTYGKVEETVANTRVGSIRACQRSRLSAGIGGQIEHLWVNEGDQIKKGQLLLNLWNRDLEAQVTLARREVEAAKSSATAMCVRAANAKRTAKRLVRLEKRKLASEEALDQASTEAEALAQECHGAQVAIGVNQARLALAEAQLAKTRLYAPFDGVVAEVYGEEGEYITPSPPGVATPPAVDLIASGCFYVSAPIDEIDSGRLRPGLETRIHIDAFGEQRFPGLLRRIAPYVLAVEKQARTVEVDVDFLRAEDEARQRPGYSADVEIVLARHPHVLRIPTEALIEGGRVLVLEKDRLVDRPIETGLSNWEWTEVIEGLAIGEQIVLSLDRAGVKAGALAMAEDVP